MRIDTIDIGIIHYLYDITNQTTSDIAKKIFECKTSQDLFRQDALIRSRLKRMELEKIILCSPTTPKTYCINPECVFCGEGTLNIKINGGKKVEVDFGDFLVIKGLDYMYINRIIKDEHKQIPKIIS
jgi:hypothetical protein